MHEGKVLTLTRFFGGRRLRQVPVQRSAHRRGRALATSTGRQEQTTLMRRPQDQRRSCPCPQGKMFDDKMTSQDTFKFDGTKGGDRWKGKVERYFISKVPAMKAILEWAERLEKDVVTDSDLRKAVGGAMDQEQLETLNAAIWGFMSNCVSGEAETMFKRAESLKGIDAWRKVVRFIDHGRSIRRETLRAEIRQLPLKPIRNLEGITVGIAEFENKIDEYVEAGGRRPEPSEMKADLLAILPESIRHDLLWKASEPGEFAPFRDMVKIQASKVLLNRKRLPVHVMEEEQPDVSRTTSTSAASPASRS